MSGTETSTTRIIVLRGGYIANIFVTSWIGISSLYFPRYSLRNVLSDDVEYSEAIRLIGALWSSIFVISVIGLFRPVEMSVIFLFQLVYKSLWLTRVVIPSILNKTPYPRFVAGFSLFWVIFTPLVIPWKHLFAK